VFPFDLVVEKVEEIAVSFGGIGFHETVYSANSVCKQLFSKTASPFSKEFTVNLAAHRG